MDIFKSRDSCYFTTNFIGNRSKYNLYSVKIVSFYFTPYYYAQYYACAIIAVQNSIFVITYFLTNYCVIKKIRLLLIYVQLLVNSFDL